MDNIKLYHWTTESLARHDATDKLIEKMLPLVDKFIETFIGHFGRGHFKNDKISPVILQTMDDEQAIGCVDAFIDFIRKNVSPRIDEVQELRTITDEMIEELFQCKYRFTLK